MIFFIKTKISFRKEIELVDRFCEWLEKRNCQYKREIRKGSYHNEGYIDVILKIGQLLIGIEAKLNNFRAVLNQASRNMVLCHYSYILYPKEPSKLFVDLIKQYRIGLIVFNSKKDRFELSVRAKRSKYVLSNAIKKVDRNWNENRVGRFFKKEEIPEDYPIEKIEALKPTYSRLKIYQEKKIKQLKKKHKALD